ncbi:FAD-dependent oxidoreductase [Nonomuraea sp. NPDC050153]|uniref:FAD-dependent oxidoreductase n=1 Tax=Nonomuraea sp. NPDC050153 TaxID=3364359 RepID=UPI0037A4ADAE
MISPNIAIVGAGPGGLIAARMLQRHGIDVTVYDADATADARDAGGSLDLHADTGQIALTDAGLLDAFMAVARVEDQSKRNMDRHGAVTGTFEPEEGDTAAPEIDRGQLRALIAAHVDPASVRWGHKLVAAAPAGDGRHRLEFANGATVEADLVIGADGVWSKVRPLVSDGGPEYSGVSFLDVRYDDAARRHPAVAQLVDRGHLFVRGDDGNAIIAQRNSNGVIRGYVAMRTDHDWAAQAGVRMDDRAAVHAYLLKQFDGWVPELLPFLTESEEYIDRAIWFMPAPPAWERTRGVTLLGDAAHAMGPFGGHGVNLALLDAVELAHAIAEEPTLDDALRRYEPVMQARAGGLAASSNRATRAFFGIGTDDIEHLAPDHAEEHRRYIEGAADYRRIRAATGTWQIAFEVPGGTRPAELSLQATHDGLAGALDGTPLDSAYFDTEGKLRIRVAVEEPIPGTMPCEATIDGDNITGTAEHPMGTLPFSGARKQTA